MHLATAAATARARGGIITPEEENELNYGEMLIDVGMNVNSHWCRVIEQVDLEQLYPSQHLAYTPATILCNSVVQNINFSVPKTLISKDTFSEVDDPH